jgi:hypothetical protein
VRPAMLPARASGQVPHRRLDGPVRVVRGRLRSGQQIRVTVDRDTHRGLRQLALDADATEVIRLLTGRALRDPGAAESIRAELDELG